MNITLQQFGIDRLSVPERLELIEKIWDSLPEQVAPDEVPEWHLALKQAKVSVGFGGRMRT